MRTVVLVLLLAATCSADDSRSDLEDFFKRRDQWILAKRLDADPPFAFDPPPAPVSEEDIENARQEVRDAQAKLLPVLKRLKLNRENPAMASLVKKDESRRKKLEDDLKEKRQRRDDLLASQKNSAKLMSDWTERRTAAFDKYAKERLVEARKQAAFIRRDMTLMPPEAIFEPDALQLGMIGRAPQWPFGGRRLLPIQMENLEQAANELAAGRVPNEFALRAIDALPGGQAAAKTRSNVEVIQVLDEHLLLAFFIGYARTPFILECESTGGHSDGSLIKLSDVLFVCRRYEYVAVDGAKRTRMVVRRLTLKDLPD